MPATDRQQCLLLLLKAFECQTSHRGRNRGIHLAFAARKVGEVWWVEGGSGFSGAQTGMSVAKVVREVPFFPKPELGHTSFES